MSMIANTEQAAAWDGEEGDRWVASSERYEASSRRHWARFLASVPIGADDRVLDVGCGTGRSTRDAARLASSGSVLGVDLSSRMLDYARRQSALQALGNVSYQQADAQVHSFDQASFDLAMSSFGAMFFNDRLAAFTNIGRALVPGGRLAVLAWQELARNEWLLAMRGALAAGRTLPAPPAGAPGPFGLAVPDQVRSMLEAGGYRDVELEAVDEPIEFGSDAQDAFGFVRTQGIVEGLTQDLDEATKKATMDRLFEMLKEHETDDGVLLGTSAWLIIATRA